MHHELARFQMCGKVTVDFPNAWRKNLMDVERESQSLLPAATVGIRNSAELEAPLCFRLEEALEEIADRCAVIAVGERQWQAALKTLSAGDINPIIIEACLRHTGHARRTPRRAVPVQVRILKRNSREQSAGQLNKRSVRFLSRSGTVFSFCQ